MCVRICICVGVYRKGGGRARERERSASQRYSKHSERNIDNNICMNTEYEYEYRSFLSCIPEHVLITAEAWA